MHLGIDNLAEKKFKPLIGAKVGICTNISSCDSNLVPTITLMSSHKKIRLKAVFAPEHGFYGALQDQVQVDDVFDKDRKMLIVSLYGSRLIPDIDILKKIDVLVIDLQDIGVRYYTFLWSAILMIKWMTLLKKKVYILDRPNPLNGETVQGPVLEPACSSFVGLYPIPIRHGMTIGELCNFINNEFTIGAELHIIKMKGWQRSDYFPETGLYWTVPSPNMPLFETAVVYPGMCLLEGTNISEGRGTTRPFETFGAPWIDPFDFVNVMQKKKISGVEFRPTYFIPTFNKYRSLPCGGAQIYVTNRQKFDSISTGLEIIRTIKHMYPDRFKWRKPPYEFEKFKRPIDILLGNHWVRKAIDGYKSISSIKNRWAKDLNRFKRTRKKYLLYK